MTISDQQRQLCLGPLRGVTLMDFRDIYARHFHGLAWAMAPFVPTVSGERVKPRLLKDLIPEDNTRLPVVPQVIGRDPGQLRVMLGALRDLGYDQANLNAGCPWPFVMKKRRGAGLMTDPDLLESMLDAGCEAMPTGFSIKVRLGVEQTDELLARIELLNRYPLRHVTIHARTARQMYDGTVHLEPFLQAAAALRHPVIYNGDIHTRSDFDVVTARFPEGATWMLGRGPINDPFLPESILKQGPEPADAPARLRLFHDALYERYRQTLFGPAPVLGRMKELWSYLHERVIDGAALLHRIQRSRTLDAYRRHVERGLDGETPLVPIRPRIAAPLSGTRHGLGPLPIETLG